MTASATPQQNISAETVEIQPRNSTETAKKQRGRPKGLGPVGIRALVRRHTATALAALSEIASRGSKAGARVAAANALLDRGWGKH